MVSVEGNFDKTVILHIVLTLLLGIVGVACNALILLYYVKKAKLDQLSIIFGSLSGFSGILSLLMIINFIFFFIGDLYYDYGHAQECQSNFGLFIAACFKVLFMMSYRTIVYILTALIFLTACKVKWPIFKIRTQLLKYLIAGYPVMLFLVVCINCFIEVSCTTPFYIPWIGRTTTMTIIYFWVLQAIPGVLSLACLVFLLQVVTCDPQTLPVELEPEQSKEGIAQRVLETIEEEEKGAVKKLKSSLSQVKTKISASKSNLSTKFEGRQVTKKTIFTIMILTTTLLVTLIISTVVPLQSIYSNNDILYYDIHHTTTDFNTVYICTVLLPVLLLAIVNPVVLLVRVNGLHKFTVRLIRSTCAPVIDAVEKRRNVDS